jgi:hypothetical protein
VPEDLDWATWLGPAKHRAYCQRLFDGEWRNVPDLGGGWYRERAGSQLALLPWLTGISLSGRWRVRPLDEVTEERPSQPQSLVFEKPGNDASIFWQFTEDPSHPIGWGMNLIGTKDSVWIAGGDARCAAETKVFMEPSKPAHGDDFDPNHRGNWIAAIRGERSPTMPLKPAVRGLALAIAGQVAWDLGREVEIDLESLTLEDDVARRREELDYASPWKLPD